MIVCNEDWDTGVVDRAKLGLNHSLIGGLFQLCHSELLNVLERNQVASKASMRVHVDHRGVMYELLVCKLFLDDLVLMGLGHYQVSSG